MVALLCVVTARAAIAWSVQLGPTWLQSQRRSSLETLGTRGLSALEEYVGRYLPHMLLAVVAPVVILVAVGSRDLVAAAIILTTLPLVPVFMAVVGASIRPGAVNG